MTIRETVLAVVSAAAAAVLIPALVGAIGAGFALHGAYWRDVFAIA